MIEKEYDLKDGSTLFWLGNQPIHECENVLVLSSGDVKFLKEGKTEKGEKIKKDINNMPKEEFMHEYHWPPNSSSDDLYWKLKRSI